MAGEFDRKTSLKKLDTLNLYIISSETSERVPRGMLGYGHQRLIQYNPLPSGSHVVKDSCR